MRRYGLILVAAALLISAAARDQFDGWIARTVLPDLSPETSVEVRDRDGDLLRAYTVADGRWRLAVSPALVDAGFVAQLVAYEDKRFYTHSGVDPIAMIRAGVQAVQSGWVVSGGSTLTMQVARLLEDSGTGRWSGKLRQIRVALALERVLSKQDILALYLTIAPYGGNLEGIRAASYAYFGKEPVRLTPADAALLVALPQSPERRRPDRNLTAAYTGRLKVLTRMQEAGVLTEDTVQAALSEPIAEQKRAFPLFAPHLSDRIAATAPGLGRHDLTLDLRLQTALEQLAETAVQGQGARMSVAMLVADHRTGDILASVGSAGYQADGRQGFVDMTQAIRSPGSTLKPLVYAMAFDDGLAHPETIIADRPLDFDGYAPQNFDGLFRGDIKVRDALQLSLNLPVVALTDAIGPARLLSSLRRSGAQPQLEGTPGLAIALGGIGVSLQDLVTLYAGLANGGQAVPLRISLNQGTGTDTKRVISETASWQIGHILAGLPAPSGFPQQHIAYKTGTSYGHRDAWAVGFDGQHVIGVWMGRPDGTPVPGAFGGGLAAPVLFEAFDRLKPVPEALPAPPPNALLLSNAALPAQLQRFEGRRGLQTEDPFAPKLAFPPNGARLAEVETLVAKVKDGQGPFTWLVNGAPVEHAVRDRQVDLGRFGKGFVALAVIDAKGRSARSTVFIE
jgi:penicillin-binding protein 1C